MSEPIEIRELQSQISHQIEVLGELVTYLGSYMAKRPEETEATREGGLVVAGVLENYYTAAETVLLRIAQHFGNQLDAERSHASLLDRLVTEVGRNALWGGRILHEYCFGMQFHAQCRYHLEDPVEAGASVSRECLIETFAR